MITTTSFPGSGASSRSERPCDGSRKRATASLLGFALAMAWITTAQAQPPPASLPDARLSWIFPAGGKHGTTFDVNVEGVDLDESTSLRFNHPGITGVPKLGPPGLGQAGPQRAPNAFEVTIKSEVKPGIYEVRVVGKYGISTPRAFVVGSQPEVKEVEPNNTLAQAMVVPLGTTINGNAKDTATDYFKFSARQGQRVLIDCWAFRIDSNMDPTLVLHDADGRELERNRNANRRDALIDFTVPRDGDYIIGLYDFLYGYCTMPGESFYRLSISTGPYLDFIFPPAGLPGSQGTFTLYGRNLPGGQPVPGSKVGGKTLEKLDVTIALPAEKAQQLGSELLVDTSEAFLDAVEYRLDSPQGPSNPLRVSVAGAPIVIEHEPNNEPAAALVVKPPCEVAGQFYPRGDRDWIAFEARKGEVYWIEVFSQRLGLPTDPYLLVQQVKKDDKGVETAIDIQGIDDMEETSTMVHWSFLSGLLFSTATHDPAYRFVAPDDGTYRVLVRDQTRTSQANPRAVYRLSIRPPQPDFRLVAVPRPPTAIPPEQGLLSVSQTTPWSPLLRRGGAELIEVFAIRRDGFDGDIEVSAGNLPPGVTAAPVVLSAVPHSAPEPVKRTTTLVLRAAEDAPSGVGAITVTGKARIGSTEVVREARPGAMIWSTLAIGHTYPRSRLTHELAIAVDGTESAPFSLDVAPNLVLETSRLGTVKLPVNLLRRNGFSGSVALALYGVPPIPSNVMHSQPLFTKPVEINAGQTTTEYTLTVPPGAPVGTYSLFLSGRGTVTYARNPAALKTALERKAAVEKIVADTAAAAKTALAAQAAAEQKRVAANAADLKAATDAKLAADKVVANTDAAAKQSAAFLQTFTQEVAKLQEKGKPAEIVTSAPSPTFTLKITPAPVALELAVAGVTLKQGARLELPVAFKRLYGFADPVQLHVKLPSDVVGVSAPAVTVPSDRSQGTLVIDAIPGATLGTHAVTVSAIATINGQPLSSVHEMTLSIEKVAPAR